MIYKTLADAIRDGEVIITSIQVKEPTTEALKHAQAFAKAVQHITGIPTTVSRRENGSSGTKR